MIAKMHKVFIVAREADKDKLLEKLRDFAVVHLVPLDTAEAVAEDQTIADIERLQRAMQIISPIEASGKAPRISALEGAAEVLEIQRNSAELSSRLSLLHQQIEHLRIWGDVELEEMEQLRRAGLNIEFYSVPADRTEGSSWQQIQAEYVDILSELSGKRCLVAVVNRKENSPLPDRAELIEPPVQDRPSLRTEAAQINQGLEQSQQRLGVLAHLIPDMEKELLEQQNRAKFTIAGRSGFAEGKLFALQGWIPAKKSEKLGDNLAEVGIEAAVKTLEPADEEAPPTLIHYPAWVSPIKGLFDILGTLPGYKELDVSPFFMVAFPLFAAMLIGDAGYGFLFLLPSLIFYRKMVAKAGRDKVNLLVVMGAASLIWGIINANYFGIGPESIAGAGGFVGTVDGNEIPDFEAMRNADGGWAVLGNVMIALAPIWDSDAEKVRALLMKISFLLGCIHISLAHLRRAVAFAPKLQCLAELGWFLFIWAMLGVIWLMFFGADEPLPIPLSIVFTAMGIGFLLFVLFTNPDRNPLKMIGTGLGASLLPMLSTFSDTMSYIRLMAVGLASYYIAVAFNSLGATVADAASWFAATPILLFGHALNMGLALIAIFAHGVRLNMLEFSNNAGVQWGGYPYNPFAKVNH